MARHRDSLHYGAGSLEDRLLQCRSREELNAAMDCRSIRRALKGMPLNPSELMVFYALNAQRIESGLPHLVPEEPSYETLLDAGIHLVSVYLLRLGFLFSFQEEPGGFRWQLNPFHPMLKTMDALGNDHNFLPGMARIIFASQFRSPGSSLS